MDSNQWFGVSWDDMPPENIPVLAYSDQHRTYSVVRWDRTELLWKGVGNPEVSHAPDDAFSRHYFNCWTHLPPLPLKRSIKL